MTPDSFLKLLKEKGSSVYYLHKATGISLGSIQDFVYGRKKSFTIPTAIKIADALNVSLDELADRKFPK